LQDIVQNKQVRVRERFSFLLEEIEERLRMKEGQPATAWRDGFVFVARSELDLGAHRCWGEFITSLCRDA